jgi:hypothetical protein
MAAMSPPRATLAVREAAEAGPGALRYEVDCPRGTTYLLVVPGSIDLHPDHLVLVVAYRHEEECGRCDLSDVFAQGDQELHRRVEALWPLAVAGERRN